MNMGAIIAVMFILAGGLGIAPVDHRISWGLVLVAGILMLVGVR